jgi:hypothetical protein
MRRSAPTGSGFNEAAPRSAVRYADLDAPPHALPSGYGALLHLFTLRDGTRRP